MIKPDKDNIVISKKPHGTCLASRGYYIPVTIMYTNNTLDIGLMWERDKIGTTQKTQPVWPHFCLGGREGEGGK